MSNLPQRQQWALLDNVPKYTVNAGTCLWRRMINEVPELCGSTPHELRSEWLLMTGMHDDAANLASPLLLDEWLWNDDSGGGTGAGDGCVSGRIYGSSFVADGTRITTRPVLAPAVSAAASATLGRSWADTTSAAAFERANNDGFVVVSVPPTPATLPAEVILELGTPLLADDTASSAGGLLDKLSLAGQNVGTGGVGESSNLGLLDTKKVGDAMQRALPTLMAAGTTAAALGVLQSHVTLQMFWVS